MSQHIAYHNYIVDLGRTVEEARQEIKAHLVGAGWQIYADTPVPAQGSRGSFVFLPPASEATGNELAVDVARLAFTGTELTLTPGVMVRTPPRQEITLFMGNYGTLNGPDHTFILFNGRKIAAAPGTFTVGSQVELATRFVGVLKADAEVNAAYFIQQRDAFVYLTRRTEGGATITGSPYIYAYHSQPPHPAGTIILYEELARSIPIDLANSFAYYLSVFSRSVVIATETVSGYYGPLAASWADNAAALKGCPPGCFPVELLTGRQSSSNNVVSFAPGNDLTFAQGYGHLLGIGGNAVRALSPSVSGAETGAAIQSLVNTRISGGGLVYLVGFAGAGNRALMPFAVGSVATPDLNVESSTYYNGWTVGGTSVAPGYAFPDLTYAMQKAPAQLKLALVGNSVDRRTLAAPLAADAVSLTLTNGAGLPQAGTLLIGDEVLRYAAREGNTVTGLTRGAYGTTAVAAAAGDAALPGGWYVRFNDAMIYAGAVKPSGVS